MSNTSNTQVDPEDDEKSEHPTETNSDSKKAEEQGVATEPLDEGHGRVADIPVDSEAADGDLGGTPTTPGGDNSQV